MNPVIVITTCPKGKGDLLKDELTKRKLAACVSSFDVKSKYWWQGSVVSDEEEMLIIKTRKDLVEDIFNLFKEIHPYTVPEFIVIPVNIVGPYLDWLNEVLAKKDNES